MRKVSLTLSVVEAKSLLFDLLRLNQLEDNNEQNEELIALLKEKIQNAKSSKEVVLELDIVSAKALVVDLIRLNELENDSKQNKVLIETLRTSIFARRG